MKAISSIRDNVMGYKPNIVVPKADGSWSKWKICKLSTSRDGINKNSEGLASEGRLAISSNRDNVMGNKPSIVVPKADGS